MRIKEVNPKTLLYPESEERRIARAIMNVHGASIWEDFAGGNTVGGDQMCEYYNRYFKYTADPANGMALRHWVLVVGMHDGELVYEMAADINNC